MTGSFVSRENAAATLDAGRLSVWFHADGQHVLGALEVLLSEVALHKQINDSVFRVVADPEPPRGQ